MSRLMVLLGIFILSPDIFANTLTVSCGESKGYAYFFEGGLVDKKNSGFSEDGINGGLTSLTLNDNNGDVLFKDATGILKSASSQGAVVLTLNAGENGINWVVIFPDGAIEIYSLNISSMKMVSYRNTVGNALVAKNSLMVSNCSVL